MMVMALGADGVVRLIGDYSSDSWRVRPRTPLGRAVEALVT